MGEIRTDENFGDRLREHCSQKTWLILGERVVQFVDIGGIDDHHS
jgi:hypothetical protein